MADVKFIIRTADQNRKAEVEMDRSRVGSDIVQAAVDNWALPTDTDYSLVNISTGKSLVPAHTAAMVPGLRTTGPLLKVTQRAIS